MEAKLKIDLPTQVDAEFADELIKESAFVSPGIEHFVIDAAGKTVVVGLLANADRVEVEDKVRRYLDTMLTNQRNSETKVIGRTERHDDGSLAVDVFETFKDWGWLFEVGPGHVAFAGPPLRLAKLVDSLAGDLYQQQFAAEERSFPAFVPATTLAQCGYFDSHPNNVTMVTHLMDDFDVIEAFRQTEGASGDMTTLAPASLKTPHLCLNPAACLPCYPTLRDQQIGQPGLTLSWLGRVFRYESKNLKGLDRLWEFNVRELVFVGTDDFVSNARLRAIDVVASLCRTLDLECRIQTATDPFFATVAAAKSFWQRAMEAKHEIRLTIAPDSDGKARTTAAGSINMHGHFFGDRFAIKAQGQDTATTACVGLGIERWVLAAFTQHGFDRDRWPADIGNNIFA